MENNEKILKVRNVDIEGFGIKQAELFAGLGWIRDLADVYYLDADQLRRQVRPVTQGETSAVTSATGLPVCT